MAGDSQTLARFRQRHQARASEGKAPTPVARRMCTVEIEPDLCEPGEFDAPFELTLRSLTSAEEMEAIRSAPEGANMALGMTLARRALYAFDGATLSSEDRVLLWEALGFGGRTAAMSAYMQGCTGASDQALGKALSSINLGGSGAP